MSKACEIDVRKNFTLFLNETDIRELFNMCPWECKKDVEKTLASFLELARNKFDPVAEQTRNEILESVAPLLPNAVADWFRDRNGYRGVVRMMCKFIADRATCLEKIFSAKVDNAVICDVQNVLTKVYTGILEKAYKCKDEQDVITFVTIGEDHVYALRSLRVPLQKLRESMPTSMAAGYMRHYVYESLSKAVNDFIDAILSYHEPREQELLVQGRARRRAAILANVGANVGANVSVNVGAAGGSASST